MKIDIVTLFPSMFDSPFGESIIKRSTDAGIVEISMHNLRDWAEDAHRSVDDRPYGGGPGMVIRVDVVDKALTDLRTTHSKVVLLSAKGERYTQQKATKFSTNDHLILVCGHYEGFDHRIYDLVDAVVSVGDYVLTGGEIAAMILVDSIIRLIPGVLGDDTSSHDESHKESGYIEHPHYTRPEEYKGKKVPEVLLSGNHARIAEWREQHSKKRND